MKEEDSKFASIIKDHSINDSLKDAGKLPSAESPNAASNAPSSSSSAFTTSAFSSSQVSPRSYRKDPAQDLMDTSQLSSEFNEYLEYFLELQKIRASKKVLIVEDDPISLLGLRHIVKNFNPDIKCFLAINIDEALDILDKEKCDLLISDYYLSPSETGLELWELVRQKHPEVDVVITSGIGTDKYRQIVQNCDFPPPFFDKPFSAEKFNGYLKEIFGGNSNGKS